MERLVGVARARVILRRLHSRQRGIDVTAIIGGGALGRERRCSRLDDRTNLLDREQEITIRLDLADQPAQHITIEQAPFVAWQHMCAVARPHTDKPFRGQCLDCFADHATSDAEACSSSGSGGRAVPAGIRSCAISRPSVVSTVLIRPGLILRSALFVRATAKGVFPLGPHVAGVSKAVAQGRGAGNHRMLNIG